MDLKRVEILLAEYRRLDAIYRMMNGGNPKTLYTETIAVLEMLTPASRSAIPKHAHPPPHLPR